MLPRKAGWRFVGNDDPRDMSLSLMKSWILLAVALLTLASGCSDGRPKRLPVSGQVLIDGKPLAFGVVQVIPANDRPATGKLDSEGRFQLTTFDTNDGCVAGTHNVAVIANESMGARAQKWHAPKKYIDAANSGLSINVSQPTDSLKIELTWSGGQPFVEQFDAE